MYDPKALSMRLRFFKFVQLYSQIASQASFSTQKTMFFIQGKKCSFIIDIILNANLRNCEKVLCCE